MAPEYYNTGVMTYKSDIYSLGVMIMEILTGKKELCTIENVRGKNHVASMTMLFLKNNPSMH